MKKYWTIIIAGVLLVAMLTASCASSGGGNPSAQTGPLRLLLSDDNNEATAIGDFESVNITISKIGFHQADESGDWIVPENYVPWTGNLLDLVGTNSSVIWDGYIEAGLYTKAFLYVSSVTGILKPEAGGGQADIWVPSGKLQITISAVPFTVTAGGGIVDFVFDITIIKSGESGKYLIVPQIAKSGPDEDYREVDEDNSQGEIDLRGTILTMADDMWTVGVGDDEEWSVNVTGAEIEGTPAVGVKVKIEGVVGEGNTILASDVEVADYEGEDEDNSDGETELTGTILTMADSMWMLRVGDDGEWSVNVTGAEIDGTPAVGTEVEIHGVVGAGGVILASEVEVYGVGEGEGDGFEGDE